MRLSDLDDNNLDFIPRVLTVVADVEIPPPLTEHEKSCARCARQVVGGIASAWASQDKAEVERLTALLEQRPWSEDPDNWECPGLAKREREEPVRRRLHAPLSDDQIEDRKRILRQQAERLKGDSE